MARTILETKIRCSFCGKTQDQVRKLVSGPVGVYICDECIAICSDIMNEDDEDEQGFRNNLHINLLKPAELYDFLNDYVIGQDEAKKALSVAV